MFDDSKDLLRKVKYFIPGLLILFGILLASLFLLTSAKINLIVTQSLGIDQVTTISASLETGGDRNAIYEFVFLAPAGVSLCNSDNRHIFEKEQASEFIMPLPASYTGKKKFLENTVGEVAQASSVTLTLEELNYYKGNYICFKYFKQGRKVLGLSQDVYYFKAYLIQDLDSFTGSDIQ